MEASDYSLTLSIVQSQLIEAISHNIARMHVGLVLFREVAGFLEECYNELQDYGFDNEMIIDIISTAMVQSLDEMPAIRAIKARMDAGEAVTGYSDQTHGASQVTTEAMLMGYCLRMQAAMGIVDMFGNPIGKTDGRYIS